MSRLLKPCVGFLHFQHLISFLHKWGFARMFLAVVAKEKLTRHRLVESICETTSIPFWTAWSPRWVKTNI